MTQIQRYKQGEEKCHIVNSFLANVSILHPLKTPEGMVFSWGVIWKHWAEMGKISLILIIQFHPFKG